MKETLSHQICESKQVSGNRIFNMAMLKAGCAQCPLFISSTVIKLFIYLQMDASQELSYSHKCRDVSL